MAWNRNVGELADFPRVFEYGFCIKQCIISAVLIEEEEEEEEEEEGEEEEEKETL